MVERGVTWLRAEATRRDAAVAGRSAEDGLEPSADRGHGGRAAASAPRSRAGCSTTAPRWWRSTCNGDALAPLAERGAEIGAASVGSDEGRAKIVEAAGDAHAPRERRRADDHRADRASDVRGDAGTRIFDVNAQGRLLPLPRPHPAHPDAARCGRQPVQRGGEVQRTRRRRRSTRPRRPPCSASRAPSRTSTGQRGVRVNSVCPGIIDTPMQDLVIARPPTLAA